METGLRNKAVLITGASKGIGKAIAASFVEEGSRVMITARGEQELKQAVQELQQLNKDANIEIFAGNLTQKAIIQQLVEATIQRFSCIISRLLHIRPPLYACIEQEDSTERANNDQGR